MFQAEVLPSSALTLSPTIADILNPMARRQPEISSSFCIEPHPSSWILRFSEISENLPRFSIIESFESSLLREKMYLTTPQKNRKPCWFDLVGGCYTVKHTHLGNGCQGIIWKIWAAPLGAPLAARTLSRASVSLGPTINRPFGDGSYHTHGDFGDGLGFWIYHILGYTVWVKNWALTHQTVFSMIVWMSWSFSSIRVFSLPISTTRWPGGTVVDTY